MISRFFIDRPIFACVLSIIITLVGLTALKKLPIEQYPNIVPPQILVTAHYPGADAQTVADTIAAPIENQINGVENMIYMFSQNSSTGSMALNVFFNIGTDSDIAQVNVQNRVNLALPQLPGEVQRTGVLVQKQTPTILLFIAIQSPDGRYDDTFVSNYASLNIVNELQRLPGISNVMIVGARDYAMRIWLRPDMMAQHNVSAKEVVDAIQDQNSIFSLGSIGQAPTSEHVQIKIPMNAKGRLSEPEEFENIIVRANPDGSMILIKDIGRVELGAQNYDVNAFLNGKSMAAIGIYQQYGANALEVAQQVKSKMEELSKSFPKGIEYTIPYDTTKFVYASIREVLFTMLEAALLVMFVVFVFLQNMRATLIPVLAMLVSIIGSFAGMYALGFSINTLTLFGLVLAIGIVVDDAIVVIENIERNMRELKLDPKEAARRAMDEVTGPVIAIVFVLCAVFIPVAFLGGIAGQLYKQFAITISISVVISGFVALTLSPAVATIVLKEQKQPHRWATWFNNGLQRMTQLYLRGAEWLIHRKGIGLGIFGLLLITLFYFFNTVPTSFVPTEDQGYVMIVANLPDGASLNRTDKVVKQISEIAESQPGVKDIVSIAGYSLLESLNRTNISANFITLTDWSERKTRALSAKGILWFLYQKLKNISDAVLLPFNPPAIHGLGSVGGFEFWIQNRGKGGIQALETATYQFIEAANKRPELAALSSNVEANNMQLFLDLDRYKSRSLGVPVADVFQTIQVLLGSVYVNDFNKFGKVYQVIVQADPTYRETIRDIGEVYVRSSQGHMVPLKSLINVKYNEGPNLVSRFNTFVAAKVLGQAASGYSSGQAMQAMEEVAKEVLPPEMSFDWGGVSYQEKVTGGTSNAMLLAGLAVVFLILSALYERWNLPLAIIMAVPFGIFGAFLAIWLLGMPNDVYFQVGLVTLIALAAKNAILIVEFALNKQLAGASTIDAALTAARLRLRAILMTSFTFILGVMPLVFSSGAGAASRRSVGVGVMGGMIAATFLAIFFVPLFFRIISEFRKKQ